VPASRPARVAGQARRRRRSLADCEHGGLSPDETVTQRAPPSQQGSNVARTLENLDAAVGTIGNIKAAGGIERKAVGHVKLAGWDLRAGASRCRTADLSLVDAPARRAQDRGIVGVDCAVGVLHGNAVSLGARPRRGGPAGARALGVGHQRLCVLC